MRTMILILITSFSAFAQDNTHYRYQTIEGTEKIVEIPRSCFQVPAPGQMGDVSSSGFLYYPNIKVTKQVNVIEQIWVPSSYRALAFVGIGQWVDDESAAVSTKTVTSMQLLDGVLFEEQAECSAYLEMRRAEINE